VGGLIVGWSFNFGNINSAGGCYATAVDAFDDLASRFPVLSTVPTQIGTLSLCPLSGVATPSVVDDSTGVMILKYTSNSQGCVGSPYMVSWKGNYCATVGVPLTLQDVFAVPSNQQAVDAWTLGFQFPMLIGLVAWGVAKVVAMLRK